MVDTGSHSKHCSTEPETGRGRLTDRQTDRQPTGMEKEREQLVYSARLAEQAERYDGTLPPPQLFSRHPIALDVAFPLRLCSPLHELFLMIWRIVLCRLIVHCESRTAEMDLFHFDMHLFRRS